MFDGSQSDWLAAPSELRDLHASKHDPPVFVASSSTIYSSANTTTFATPSSSPNRSKAASSHTASLLSPRRPHPSSSAVLSSLHSGAAVASPPPPPPPAPRPPGSAPPSAETIDRAVEFLLRTGAWGVALCPQSGAKYFFEASTQRTTWNLRSFVEGQFDAMVEAGSFPDAPSSSSIASPKKNGAPSGAKAVVAAADGDGTKKRDSNKQTGDSTATLHRSPTSDPRARRPVAASAERKNVTSPTTTPRRPQNHNAAPAVTSVTTNRPSTSTTGTTPRRTNNAVSASPPLSKASVLSFSPSPSAAPAVVTATATAGKRKASLPTSATTAASTSMTKPEGPSGTPLRRAPTPSLRDRLIDMYRQHEPSKILLVDELLDRYAGNEGELWRHVTAKYLTRTATGSPPPSARSTTAQSSSSRRTQPPQPHTAFFSSRPSTGPHDHVGKHDVQRTRDSIPSPARHHYAEGDGYPHTPRTHSAVATAPQPMPDEVAVIDGREDPDIESPQRSPPRASPHQKSTPDLGNPRQLLNDEEETHRCKSTPQHEEEAAGSSSEGGKEGDGPTPRKESPSPTARSITPPSGRSPLTRSAAAPKTSLPTTSSGSLSPRRQAPPQQQQLVRKESTQSRSTSRPQPTKPASTTSKRSSSEQQRVVPRREEEVARSRHSASAAVSSPTPHRSLADQQYDEAHIPEDMEETPLCTPDASDIDVQSVAEEVTKSAKKEREELERRRRQAAAEEEEEALAAALAVARENAERKARMVLEGVKGAHSSRSCLPPATEAGSRRSTTLPSGSASPPSASTVGTATTPQGATSPSTVSQRWALELERREQEADARRELFRREREMAKERKADDVRRRREELQRLRAESSSYHRDPTFQF